MDLWLRLVGEFAVRRNGRLQPAREVGSRKARTLLALLAVERGRVVALDRIGEVLWGDFPPREPADNVATLVSRLRAVLGPDVVAGGRAGYRLGDPVGVDLADAAAMVAEAEARLSGGEPALALTATAAALDLLRGGAVLADEAWAGRARDQQAELLRRAWHAAGEAGLRSGDHPAARSAAEAAVTADPLDEVAYRILMRAHAATGEPARALLGYERLRAVLARELGVDPAPATRDLHLAILRAETPAPATLAPVSPRPAPLPGPGAGPGAGRGGTAGLRPAPSAGLAGRDPDVARLAETWAAAAAGHPRLLLITGEAGIGKTRLAGEVVRLARATGGVVAQARCYEAERSLFLQPVVEALTQLVTGLPAAALKEAAGARAGTLAALVPEAATVLAAAPAEHGSAEAERRRAYDAVAGFLRRFSAGRPVLLVLDDLHHAGDATVELLHYLPRHAAGGRLLVVATLRVEEGEPVRRALAEVAERLDLGPLDTRAIARLATAAGQDAMVGEIARRTRGHTLFVVETLRGLAAGESGVPESMRDSVLARVRRAGGTAEELLRAAAVLGPSFAPRSSPACSTSVPRRRPGAASGSCRPGSWSRPAGRTSSPTTSSRRFSTRRRRCRPGPRTTAAPRTCSRRTRRRSAGTPRRHRTGPARPGAGWPPANGPPAGTRSTTPRRCWTGRSLPPGRSAMWSSKAGRCWPAGTPANGRSGSRRRSPTTRRPRGWWRTRPVTSGWRCGHCASWAARRGPGSAGRSPRARPT